MQFLEGCIVEHASSTAFLAKPLLGSSNPFRLGKLQAAALATAYAHKGSAEGRKSAYTEATRWHHKAHETATKLLDPAHPLRYETERAVVQADA